MGEKRMRCDCSAPGKSGGTLVQGRTREVVEVYQSNGTLSHTRETQGRTKREKTGLGYCFSRVASLY